MPYADNEDKKRNRREYQKRTDYSHHKKWREENPERWAEICRRSRYKRKYGITPEQYDEMFEQQNGSCAICDGTDPKGPGERFAVDHCHDTGQVRALLCGACNTALGKFGDSPELLRKAADYVIRHRETQTA